MSIGWIFRVAERAHPLLVPAALATFLGCLFAWAFLTTEGGWVKGGLDHRQLLGTLTLFALLPAYLLAAIPRQRRRAEEARDALAPEARAADVAAVTRSLEGLPSWTWAGVVIGTLIGLGMNPLFLEQMYGSRELYRLDVIFVSAACGLWILIGISLAWKLPVSRALSVLGGNLKLDLYRLDRLKPLARVASTDILVVAGAMAFTPLQSLDAEFRFGNYGVAIVVATLAAAAVFVLPLLGLRRNLQATKAVRLEELREQWADTDRSDIARVETLSAHIDRIRTIPNWPVDLESGTRLVGYVIIPPLAWVAAALVENFVDSF